MSPNIADVTFSLQAIIWLAVGGPGSLLAPLVGVLAVQLGQQYLSNGLTASWELLLGGLLILLVLVAPGGLTGLGARLGRELQRRARATA
jgi:urea transport system permease protein